MAEINWSIQAWDELAEINFRLSEGSEKYANFIIDSVLSSVEYLQQFPHLGRVVPEMNMSTIRELIIQGYRLIYLVSPEKNIEILTIRHSSRPLSDTILPSN